MSIFPRESVTAIGDTLGLNLSPEVCDALVQDTEYRLREIIHESLKFMRHSKRNKLVPRDISSAMAVKSVEPLYGFAESDRTSGNGLFKMTQFGGQTLYYLEDKEYDLEELINMPLPPIPHQMTFTAHWLAVEGVQPRIPENPAPSDVLLHQQVQYGPVSGDKKITPTLSTVPRGDASEPSGAVGASAETSTSTEGSSAPRLPRLEIPGVPGSGNTSKVPLVKDVLTKELQIYYEKITESLQHQDAQVRQLAIESVSTDPGLQGLVPYFVQFIADTITRHLKQLDTLWTMIRLCRALLHNADLFIEPYLHQMIPSILTCVVAKHLSSPSSQIHTGLQSDPSSHPPTSETEIKDTDHFSLRLYASHLLSHICLHYGTRYPTLQPRVTKTLLRALLDPLKPLSTVYGALVALRLLGHQVLEVLVVPNLATVVMRMDAEGGDTTVGEQQAAEKKEESDEKEDDKPRFDVTNKPHDVQKVYQAALDAAVAFLEYEIESDPKIDNEYLSGHALNKLRKKHGDALGVFGEPALEVILKRRNQDEEE